MARQKNRKAAALSENPGQQAGRGKRSTSAGHIEALRVADGRSRTIEPSRKPPASKATEGKAAGEEDSGRRWIESAYQAFVLKRTSSTVHQDARLTPDKALSAGEIHALQKVGFDLSIPIAKQARRARERMVHTYFDIVHNSVSAAAVAKFLGVDVSRIRQRARERSLYAFDVDGEHRFPLVQFEKTKEVPGLTKVLPELPADLTPIEFVTWFVTGTNELGDPEGDVHPSPREWLIATGDPEPVIALARDY